LLIHTPSVTDRTQLDELIAETEQRCPYSNAVRGNVAVTLTPV
jgi:organic hydroperoxide reductase OsmC/OhrA